MTSTVESLEMMCMSCKDSVEVPDPQLQWIDTKRGPRLSMKGKCPRCGTVCSRFVSKDYLPEPQEDEANSSQSDLAAHAQDEDVATPMWRGMCQVCRETVEITGEYIGERWDGKKVVQGRCGQCTRPQVFIGVEELDE